MVSLNNRLHAHSKIEKISIGSSLELTEQKAILSFVVKGALEEYLFPSKSILKRANELWKSTCFELFLANENEEAYYELNFSSSLAWNFYTLDAYRGEVKELGLLDMPKISVFEEKNEFKILIELPIENLENFELYNVACILLNREDERTFWTIKHLKPKPDFHDRASFLRIS